MTHLEYITIYPEQWKGDWKDWPECHLHFRDGNLQDYKYLLKGDI